ncbi:hypothetical protein E2C01_047272 [Portunus trituberculatus]|uniref:Uncharacterized protein n=1 Tax=Portunus trituberculatus TaxID=210409 RepID=A0A5B7G839_PORTR|nr:hypothetical protein [Portunus trituberculatus]
MSRYPASGKHHWVSVTTVMSATATSLKDTVMEISICRIFTEFAYSRVESLLRKTQIYFPPKF